MVEILVTMIVSGILLLAVYDGLTILNSGIARFEGADDCQQLNWLEHFEILEFRSDSVRVDGALNVFYVCGEPVDTLADYGL